MAHVGCQTWYKITIKKMMWWRNSRKCELGSVEMSRSVYLQCPLNMIRERTPAVDVPQPAHCLSPLWAAALCLSHNVNKHAVLQWSAIISHSLRAEMVAFRNNIKHVTFRGHTVSHVKTAALPVISKSIIRSQISAVQFHYAIQSIKNNLFSVQVFKFFFFYCFKFVCDLVSTQLFFSFFFFKLMNVLDLFHCVSDTAAVITWH